MFYGVYDFSKLKLEKINEFHIYHKKNDSECYFIGEILSNEQMTYEAFGDFIQDQNPNHLLFLSGNYQVIVRIGNRLWLFSDLANIRPIFFKKQNHCLLFSSHFSNLFEISPSSLHVPWSHRYLGTDGFHIETESPIRDIYSVSNGYGLVVGKNEMKQFQAWQVDNESQLSLEEAKDKLKNDLIDSVVNRVHNNKRITADLSGGLDSSTLTWIASRYQQVKSMTFIGKEENEDLKIAREISNRNIKIDHFEIDQKDIPLIYSDIENIKTDLPIPFLWSANKVRCKLLWAKDNKSDIHLSGEGGDTVLGADHTYLSDLIYQRKWITYLSHTIGWAHAQKQSVWSWILGSSLPVIGFSYNTKERHMLNSNDNQADWFQFQTNIKSRRYSKMNGVSNTMLGIHYLGYISRGIKDLADHQGIQICFPFLDHNVIRTCIRTPSELKMNPHILKPLLKNAFQHDLPDVLLNRNSKGDYTSDVYYGMEQKYNWFQRYFKEMVLADLGLINLEKFKECFERLLLGVPVKLPEFHQTISLEIWLRQNKLG